MLDNFIKTFELSGILEVEVGGLIKAKSEKEAVEKFEEHIRENIYEYFEDESIEYESSNFKALTVNPTGDILWDDNVDPQQISEKCYDEVEILIFAAEFTQILKKYLELNWWCNFDKKVLVVDFQNTKLATEEYKQYLKLKKEYDHNNFVSVFPVINYVRDSDVSEWISTKGKKAGFVSQSNLILSVISEYKKFLNNRLNHGVGITRPES